MPPFQKTRTGSVSKWDERRGFGYVCDDADGQEVFCHVRHLDNNHGFLLIGQKVKFEIAINARNKKPEAVQVQLLE
jgi:cold shock protein